MKFSSSKHGSLENLTAISQVKKIVYRYGNKQMATDEVITEQPLQIRLFWSNCNSSSSHVFSITMRTPGDDEALIIGLLLTEGVIKSIDNIADISPEYDTENHDKNTLVNNLWEVQFTQGFIPQLASIERYQVTYSSCGLCGTTSLKSLELKSPPILNTEHAWLSSDIVCQSPDIMSANQSIFAKTGGAHAAAMFNEQGDLLDLYEDIGRHNALDKLFGARLTSKKNNISQNKPSNESNKTKITINKTIVVISSRISFEIIQKTVMAGVPVLIAVGAPSDLAIAAAKRFDLTLIGFASQSSFNIYHGEWRLHSLEDTCQKI